MSRPNAHCQSSATSQPDMQLHLSSPASEMRPSRPSTTTTAHPLFRYGRAMPVFSPPLFSQHPSHMHFAFAFPASRTDNPLQMRCTALHCCWPPSPTQNIPPKKTARGLDHQRHAPSPCFSPSDSAVPLCPAAAVVPADVGSHWRVCDLAIGFRAGPPPAAGLLSPGNDRRDARI